MVTTDSSTDLVKLRELVDAVAGRLRSLGEARLGRPPMRVGLGVAEPLRTDGPSVADRARGLAQVLADLCADLEGRAAAPLPYLPDLAVGDMVAVTGHDLVALVETSQDDSVDDAYREAVAALRALRADL